MKRQKKSVVVIGAGGHAKVVLSALIEGGVPVGGLLDDDQRTWGRAILGVRVLGSTSLAEGMPGRPAVLAVGNNAVRKALARRLHDLAWVTVVHPKAYVHSTARLGCGSVVFSGAVIQPDAIIGEHCIVNTGATIDHDCVLGDYAHIAPGVNLAGNVRIGEGVLFGIGGAAAPGVSIGDWATIGAGGVVTGDLPAKTVAAGIPARAIRGRKRGRTESGSSC